MMSFIREMFTGFAEQEDPNAITVRTEGQEKQPFSTGRVVDFREYEEKHNLCLGRFDQIVNIYHPDLFAFKCSGDGPKDNIALERGDEILALKRGSEEVRCIVREVFYYDEPKGRFMVEAHQIIESKYPPGYEAPSEPAQEEAEAQPDMLQNQIQTEGTHQDGQAQHQTPDASGSQDAPHPHQNP